MTAKTRQIRSDGFDPADETALRRETGSVTPAPPARPINDNARAQPARMPEIPQDDAFDDDADRPEDGDTGHADEACEPAARAAPPPPRARRRGALVTRWIGFAARRQRIQARADAMRDRWNPARSEQPVH